MDWKTSVLPKLIYRFNVILIKIPANLIALERLNIKFMIIIIAKDEMEKNTLIQ